MICFVFSPRISAYVSNSLKKETLIAKYVLANNLTASASVGLIYKTGISVLIAPSCSIFANTSADLFNFSSFKSVPTIILDGYKLSYKARPSRRNSGENRILLVWYFSLTDSVYPTGTVDLIIIIALGFTSNTCSITLSTEEVSK